MIAATKARHKAWKEGTDAALTDEEKRALMNAINVKKTAMQDEAVEAIVAQLLPVDSRGNIQIACGGGKTRVGVRAADALITKLVDRGDVSKRSRPLAIVVLVPNLALLPQTAREWKDYCEEKDKDGAAGCSFSCTAVSVCSMTTLDKKGKRKELTGNAADDADGGVDVEATQEQLKALPEEWSNIAKTTEERSAADALYAWLVPRDGGEAAAAEAASRPRVRLVLSTYHSADQVAQALYKVGEKRALMTIFDEAHVTARKGKARPGSLEEKVDFTRALREYRLTSADAGASSSAVSERLDGLGSERRLFMTATPRVPKGSKVRERGAAGKARKTAGGDEAEGGPEAGEAGGEEEEEEEALQTMADPAKYGPRVFTCTMEEAIERSLIRDYAICVVGFRGDASARELLQTAGKRFTAISAAPVGPMPQPPKPSEVSLLRCRSTRTMPRAASSVSSLTPLTLRVENNALHASSARPTLERSHVLRFSHKFRHRLTHAAPSLQFRSRPRTSKRTLDVEPPLCSPSAHRRILAWAADPTPPSSTPPLFTSTTTSSSNSSGRGGTTRWRTVVPKADA